MKSATQTPTRSTPQTPISNRGFDAQFLGMVPRFNPLILDGVVASIDSVRLKFVYHKSAYDFEAQQRFDTINRLLCLLDNPALYSEGLFDIETSPERSFKIGNYSRTITYSHPEGWSFAVLIGRYCYDSSVKKLAPEAVIDFNPNKVPMRAWNRIVSILRCNSIETTVQRFDLAMDFPVARAGLSLQEREGTRYQKIVEDGITEYLGMRSHHAAVKLYDKSVEIGMEAPCTRLEITIDPKKFKGLSDLYPTILTTTPLDLSLDFTSLPFQVQAVLIHPDLYPILKASVSRNTWPKYDRMIREYSLRHGPVVLALNTDQMSEIDRYIGQYITSLITGAEGGAMP